MEDSHTKGPFSIYHYGERSVPRLFYKYRTWSASDGNGHRIPNTQHQQILHIPEIYFASVLDLNDPSEGTNPLRYDLLSKEERLQIIKRHIRQDCPRMRKHKIRNYARHVDSFRHWQNRNNISRVQKELLRRIGVFSASETRDDLNLWTHYADSHKGFCIGFDAELVDRYCRRIVNYFPLEHAPLIVAYPITYAREKPVIIPNRSTGEDRYLAPLLTKAVDYAHEKEMRFFNLNAAGKPLSLPPATVKEVILGCRISEDDESEIIELLQRKMPHVTIYRAQMADDSFNLRFEQLRNVT